MECNIFLGIGRTGRVFHLFCPFHLREWNSWKNWNSSDRFRWTLDFHSGMTSVPFEMEQVEVGMLIPVIPLPEKSQKECSLSKQLIQDLDYSIPLTLHSHQK